MLFTNINIVNNVFVNIVLNIFHVLLFFFRVRLYALGVELSKLPWKQFQNLFEYNIIISSKVLLYIKMIILLLWTFFFIFWIFIYNL